MLNRRTGSQHGKNKKNAPVPPQSEERLVDQPNYLAIFLGGVFGILLGLFLTHLGIRP